MRPRRLRNKLLLMLALMGVSSVAFAQKAKYMAQLPKAHRDDMYIIKLPPAITAKANSDLSDIRIADTAGRAIPYMFGDKIPNNASKPNFVNFKQLAGGAGADTVTTFTVETPSGYTGISQFALVLRNTAVGRKADLSGSDDLKNWYAIKEGIVLQKTGDNDGAKGSFEQLITFPSSNYRYFRLKVDNGPHDPVAILAAGIYRAPMEEKPDYWQLENIKFTQKDSGKTSRIFINFDDNHRVDDLVLLFTGTRYYKRSIRIYEIKGRQRNLLMSGYVGSSDDPNMFFSAKTKKLEAEIDNEDNPPLVVSSVKAWQLHQSVIAYLNTSKEYRLLFGDSTATTPNYDLHFFADSVRGDGFISVLEPEEVKNNPKYSSGTLQTATKSFPTWALWAVIVAVLTALAAMTFKMTKEVGKRG
nr:hypothetical protein [uncultured Mucilaginibacter sp.]